MESGEKQHADIKYRSESAVCTEWRKSIRSDFPYWIKLNIVIFSDNHKKYVAVNISDAGKDVCVVTLSTSRW